MDIKEFQKHTKAWSAFFDWYSKSEAGQFFFFGTQCEYGIPFKTLPLYLQLTILQAWLDSVGIYADTRTGNGTHLSFYPEVRYGEKYYGSFMPTRPEALFAAISKGLEIYSQTK